MEWWDTGQIGQKVQVSKTVQRYNNARRRDEIRLIFHLGTLTPHGLNVDSFFKQLDARGRIYALESRV